jgi:N-acetylmuramic acid 6-phosphate etherase
MIRLGKVYENWMVDLQTKSDKLVARARRIVSVLGGVDEKRATLALEAAGGRAKTAIVMLRKQLGRGPAERLLRRHGGMLRTALES